MGALLCKRCVYVYNIVEVLRGWSNGCSRVVWFSKAVVTVIAAVFGGSVSSTCRPMAFGKCLVQSSYRAKISDSRAYGLGFTAPLLLKAYNTFIKRHYRTNL